ncbi:MAG: hypothetical protein HQM08_16660 [Candidatus Riflebacteria bacterium]|nr:hypothetical protein [Candidatus Riflebacteria bacterium]
MLKSIAQAPKTTEDKILFFFESGNFTDGLELFKKNYNSSNPPSEILALGIFRELQGKGAVQISFDFINEVDQWLPDNEKLKRAQEIANDGIFDIRLKAGHDALKKAEALAAEFNSMAKTGAVGQEKLREENERVFRNMVESALEKFKEALKFKPTDIRTLRRMQFCYEQLEQSEEVEKILRRVAEIELGPTEGLVEDETKAIEIPKIESEEDIRQRKLEELQAESERFHKMEAEGKIDELIPELKNFLLKEQDFQEGRVLLAKIYLDRKEYFLCQRMIDWVLHVDPRFKPGVELQKRFQEQRLGLLKRGANSFLSKALLLGTYHGLPWFQKAEKCLSQALEIVPNDVEILDNLHLVYSYMGNIAEATRMRGRLLLEAPDFKPTWDKEMEKSHCFLAGYAYSEEPDSLNLFRKFRKNFLLNNFLGSKFNFFYLSLSPSLISIAKRYKIPPLAFRAFLFPLKILFREILKNVP